MTGRGVEITDDSGNTDRMVFTQNKCAAWLRKFSSKLEFEELTHEEALDGLDEAQRLSIQGRESTITGTRWFPRKPSPTSLSLETRGISKGWRVTSRGRNSHPSRPSHKAPLPPGFALESRRELKFEVSAPRS